MQKNIKPYFELIGLESLEQPLGTTKYKFLSQFLDELEQEIDNTHSKVIDDWFNRNEAGTLHKPIYSGFYKSYTELLTLKIPKEIKQKVQFLINNLPKPL